MALSDSIHRSTANGSAAEQKACGRGQLRDPRLNRGTAFTAEERSTLGLEGLLPAGVLSLEEQAKRSYEQYGAQPTDLAKNDFLAALHDRNAVLYYKLLGDHLTEMLPVVYDPVVAQAIERYSHEFQRPNGVYLSIDDVDGVETAFRNYALGADDVDLLVATDAEEILGIGGCREGPRLPSATSRYFVIAVTRRWRTRAPSSQFHVDVRVAPGGPRRAQHRPPVRFRWR